MKIQDLISRGLVQNASNFNEIAKLPDNTTFYVGFDPTANSLHIGHLLPLVTMRRLKELGANPIAVIGGATARVGDPTGRTSTRPILTEEELKTNIENIKSQINSIVDCEIVDNKDFAQVNFLDFVSDIGRHFSVNTMLKTDTFRTKLETGLSFLEFSYSLLQANDFLNLFVKKNCLLQIGGSDQWANMIAGIDLIHAKQHKQAHCLTLPILEDKNGNKFGKSAGNAIWLDKEKTSAFDFWQFWRNVPDDMVKTLFMFFTFLPVEQIISKFNKNTSLDNISLLSGDEINSLKEELADLVTGLVHPGELESVKNKVKVLFGDQSEDLVESTAVESFKLVSEMLRDIGAAASRSEALRLIQQKGIKINSKQISIDFKVGDLGKGKFLVEKGKKNKFLIEIK